MHYGVADGTILAVSTDALAHCTVHILFYQAPGAPVSVKPLAHTHRTHTHCAPEAKATSGRPCYIYRNIGPLWASLGTLSRAITLISQT